MQSNSWCEQYNSLISQYEIIFPLMWLYSVKLKQKLKCSKCKKKHINCICFDLELLALSDSINMRAMLYMDQTFTFLKNYLKVNYKFEFRTYEECCKYLKKNKIITNEESKKIIDFLNKIKESASNDFQILIDSDLADFMDIIHKIVLSFDPEQCNDLKIKEIHH